MSKTSSPHSQKTSYLYRLFFFYLAVSPTHNLFMAHFIFIAFFTSLKRIGHSDFSLDPALFTLMHFSGVGVSVAGGPSLQTDDFNAC